MGRRKFKDEGKSCDTECVQISQWVAFYIEGEAAPEIRQQLLIHIQSCAACARLVRSLKRLVDYCSIEPGWDVPERAHKLLWEALRQNFEI